MKYLVAVSGGVDSVVLLHIMAAQRKHDLTVAHFDHGIRPDSAADFRFVEALAKRYGLAFVGRREDLGEKASEDLARERRYRFLRAEAEKRQATIVTAHHADDVIETIAINLTRGTGWRGVAVLGSSEVSRPLLPYFKKQILEYAVKRRLEWVEDSTNATEAYLRNRIRRRASLHLSLEAKQDVLDIWKEQLGLKQVIDSEVGAFAEVYGGEYSRYFFTHVDAMVAVEILRGIVVSATGRSLTRPQLERLLLAVKTARPNTRFLVGDVELSMRKKTFLFSVKTP